jgi:hypothetical protein
MNIFKFLYWHWKKERRIKYPRKFKREYIYKDLPQLHHDFNNVVCLQEDIKKETGKYYTLCECYDLMRLAKSRSVEDIKRFIR